MKLRILPYKAASTSAKLLANAIGAKRIRKEGPNRAFKGGFVINWGNSSLTRQIDGVELLNKPEAVDVSIDKLRTFRVLSEAGVSIPEFTTNVAQARVWIEQGRKIVCRTKLRSYGGDGIVIAESADELVAALLYVRYIPKQDEYRVHVFRDRVFFVQRKARKNDVPDENVNWAVRNLAGGFIYANQDVDVSDEIKQSCIRAITALGLDFGAVDVIVTPRGRHFILEVNTACGLSGTTLEKYAEVFKSLSQS